MRKAATRDDFDFEFDDREAGGDRESAARRWLGANPAARVGLGGLAALGLAIVVNAVFLQDQRHAAPLFQTSLRNAAPADQDAPASPPMPAPRPVELTVAPQPSKAAPSAKVDAGRNDPIGRAIAQMDSQPARVEKPKPAEPKTAEARSDAIGGLIRNVVAPAPAAQASEPNTSVMAAQRALQKLGFVVRPNGLYGETTRQAIERFERDNRMPVRGELTARVKAELARQSGIEIR